MSVIVIIVVVIIIVLLVIGDSETLDDSCLPELGLALSALPVSEGIMTHRSERASTTKPSGLNSGDKNLGKLFAENHCRLIVGDGRGEPGREHSWWSLCCCKYNTTGNSSNVVVQRKKRFSADSQAIMKATSWFTKPAPGRYSPPASAFHPAVGKNNSVVDHGKVCISTGRMGISV